MLVLLHRVVIAVVLHRQFDEVAVETVTEGIQVEGINTHVMREDKRMVVEVLIFWKGAEKKYSLILKKCLNCFLILGSLVDVLNVKLEP